MRTSITVQNLRCGGCANTIRTKLSAIAGISEIDVEIQDSKISFNSDTDDGAILAKTKLKSLGYPSVDDKNSLLDKGRSFVSCATGKMS